MKNWQKTKWGEVATLEYGKAFRDYDEEDGTYPVFGTNGQIGWHEEPLVNRPGVIIGRKGAYRGVEYSDKPFCVIDTAFYLNLTTDKILDKWAYYQLKDFDINNIDSGTAIPSTSREAFYQIPVEIPPIEEQKKIVKNLSAFDDLIENNTRRIEILEEMARRIYREWFVHFRYPGHEEDELVDSGTDLGEIPKGWEIGKVKEHFTINNGYAFKSEEYKEEGLLVIRSKDFTGQNYIKIDDKVYISRPIPEKYEKYKLQELDFLMVMVGSIGKYGIVYDKDLPALQNQNMWAIRPREQSSIGRYYAISLMPELVNKMLSYATGSTRSYFRQSDFKKLELVVPHREVMDHFLVVIKPIYDQLNVLLKQRKNLKETRDLLLPKLISGKIEV